MIVFAWFFRGLRLTATVFAFCILHKISARCKMHGAFAFCMQKCTPKGVVHSALHKCTSHAPLARGASSRTELAGMVVARHGSELLFHQIAWQSTAGRGAVFCAGMGRARMRVGGSTFAVAHSLPTCEPSRRCGRRRQSVQPAPMRSPRNRRIAGLRLRQSCDTAALVGRIARIVGLLASMKSGVVPALPPVYPRLPPLDPARLPDSPLGRWSASSRCSFGGRGMGDMARGGGGGVETRTRPLRMPMTSQGIWPRENKAPIKRR